MDEYIPWNEMKITKENYLDAIYDLLDSEFHRIEHAHIGGVNTGKSYNNIQEIMGHFEELKEEIESAQN